jgi:hypothetical protein
MGPSDCAQRGFQPRRRCAVGAGPLSGPGGVPVPVICHSCGRFGVRRCGKKAVGHRDGERCEASWRSVRWCGGRVRPRHAGRTRAAQPQRKAVIADSEPAVTAIGGI